MNIKNENRYPKLEKVPKFDNLNDLFNDIKRICNDKKGHPIMQDHIDYLNYKFRIIKKLLRENNYFIKDNLWKI